MSFLQAAIETASNTNSDNAVVVTTTAMETLQPSEGIISSTLNFVSDNKETILTVAVVAGTAYAAYRWAIPALRKCWTEHKDSNKDSKPKAEPQPAPAAN